MLPNTTNQTIHCKNHSFKWRYG